MNQAGQAAGELAAAGRRRRARPDCSRTSSRTPGTPAAPAGRPPTAGWPRLLPAQLVGNSIGGLPVFLGAIMLILGRARGRRRVRLGHLEDRARRRARRGCRCTPASSSRSRSPRSSWCSTLFAAGAVASALIAGGRGRSRWTGRRSPTSLARHRRRLADGGDVDRRSAWCWPSLLRGVALPIGLGLVWLLAVQNLLAADRRAAAGLGGAAAEGAARPERRLARGRARQRRRHARGRGRGRRRSRRPWSSPRTGRFRRGRRRRCCAAVTSSDPHEESAPRRPSPTPRLAALAAGVRLRRHRCPRGRTSPARRRPTRGHTASSSPRRSRWPSGGAGRCRHWRWRPRRPRAYLMRGYPYGPILLSFAVAVYTVARAPAAADGRDRGGDRPGADQRCTCS